MPAAASLRLAQLEARIRILEQDARPVLDRPEWCELEEKLLAALRDYPDALEAIYQALVAHVEAHETLYPPQAARKQRWFSLFR